MQSNFQEYVSAFGQECEAKLGGPGEEEALLTAPVSNLLTSLGSALGHTLIAHDEVAEFEGALRADFAVSVNGVLTGHVEMKKPGTSLDPTTYGRTTHNAKQWKRLRELPNLLHTNGWEWRLWRNGELVGQPVQMGGKWGSIKKAGSSLFAGNDFEALIADFFSWKPLPITSVRTLVMRVTPLSRVLREEVIDALKAERRAVKAGAPESLQPFLGAAASWRRLLMPSADDASFADSYAQTVTFALLLARAEGLDLEGLSLHEISQKLDAGHSLMGKALELLTKHATGPVSIAVAMLSRVISAVQWKALTTGTKDVYLHLYEDFLEYYDPELREKTGSYYTPIEVVDGMVRLTEEVLRKHFGKSRTFRDHSVAVVDGSMGTGTYPLSILKRAADQASEEYGPAAASEALTALAPRLYGLEMQSGPFSVAELRITEALRQAGATLPDDGLPLFVTNTLESPWTATSNELSYTEQLIAVQRQRANAMKRERNVQVVISNPPYEERATGLGGWIEKGDAGHEASGVPLDAFRLEGNGKHEGLALKNLYVYFWRWAMWKVFESTPTTDETPNGGDGIVSYITANGYLTGPGFKGMRKYIRETCSNGWIIDISPEGKMPPAKNAVFKIETPVAIAIFIRSGKTTNMAPAEIKHITLHGTRKEKFEQLATLSLDDARWLPVRSGWTDTFTPKTSDSWDAMPAANDLFPWNTTGVTSNRSWVYSPSAETLEFRFNNLVQEPDVSKKGELMKSTRDSTPYKTKSPLPAVSVSGTPDTCQSTDVSLANLTNVTDMKTVQVSYRSFDRQHIVADSRVLDMPRPPLWAARGPGQIFITEQHSIHPRSGPGLMFNHLMPDQNAFNGRGGRVLPIYHPNGRPNTAPGLLEALADALAAEVQVEDLAAYVAAITGHPGFVSCFDAELQTPGLRVPLTSDPDLWKAAVEIGKRVLWLHSFGANFVDMAGNRPPNVRNALEVEHAMYQQAVTGLPEEMNYDETTRVLHIGSGSFSPVSPAVMNYQVGGRPVIQNWFAYRRKNPTMGRSTTTLDHVQPPHWESEWSLELLELLSVLEQLTSLEKSQDALLAEVLAKPTISRSALEELGCRWPVDAKGSKDRKADFSDADDVLFSA